jgi:hypothetical protein
VEERMIDVENFLKNLKKRDKLHREMLKIDNEIYIFEDSLKIQLREYCKKLESSGEFKRVNYNFFKLSSDHLIGILAIKNNSKYIFEIPVQDIEKVLNGGIDKLKKYKGE